MKRHEELVATSADFDSKSVQVLLCKDENYLCVLANGKVSMYIVKTGRLVGQLCENGRPREDINFIWKRTDKDKSDENDLVYCLAQSCIISFNPITGTVVSQVIHPEFLQLPPFDSNLVKVLVTFKSPEFGYQPDRIYCAIKQDVNTVKEENKSTDGKQVVTKKRRKGDCFVTGYTFHKKKGYKFGQVNQVIKNVLFGANSNLVVKVADTVVGKKGTNLLFFTPEGLCLDTHTVPKDRPITCLSMHPTELVVASGDKSGKIFVWRNSHDDPNRFFSTQMHWHSLPVRALAWTNNIFSDSKHLYSGGEEGAILKWDTRSARRVGIVPRIGCTIAHISADSGTVVAVNSNNSLKLFSTTFEDIASIVGLAQRKSVGDTRKTNSKQSDDNIDLEKFFELTNKTGIWKLNYLQEKSRTKLFYHNGIQAVALLNGSKNQIQLFDPILKTEKLALDVSSYNTILGDRPTEEDGFLVDEVPKSSKITLFTLSQCGTWLVTVESNYDTLGGQCTKIWHFTSPSNSMGEGKFTLNTQINEDISSQIFSAEFLIIPNFLYKVSSRTNGLITCGSDKKAKLWRLSNDQDQNLPITSSPGKWESVRMFTYLDLIPKCSAGSPDQSTFAIGFGPRLTLWDSETFSLLTCLSIRDNNTECTSVVFGNGSKQSHLVLATTESHVLVWNLLTSHLIKRMVLDRPTLVPLTNSIGVLHSHGAISLDHSLNVNLITNLESVGGIASDDRSNRTYLLHSTESCENMLTSVKLDDTSDKNTMPEELEADSNTESFNILLKHNIDKLENKGSPSLHQARTNSKQLSYDLITSVISDCSATFVKLSLPM